MLIIENDDCTLELWNIVHLEYGVVAQLPKGQDDETKERQLALAKLFAAAPRLLEVCKLVLKRLDLEASEREARGQDNIFPCAALRNDLRAAIAEAEGRGA